MRAREPQLPGQQSGPGRTCVLKTGRAGWANNWTPGAGAQEQRGGRHGSVCCPRVWMEATASAIYAMRATQVLQWTTMRGI